MAWNRRGQGFRPARLMSRSNCVRRLQFRQPLGVLAALRYSPSTTYSAPSGASSKASDKIGFSSANRGIVRLTLPGRWDVFGDRTTLLSVSRFTSCHRRESTSLGHRKPPYRARTTITRPVKLQTASSQAVSSGMMKCCHSGRIAAFAATSAKGLSTDRRPEISFSAAADHPKRHRCTLTSSVVR